ncbi:hypothetical protein SLEP1_g33983 [Rubroshorea leprosula]|uniref:Uncharacterized protein n=1 Tax=Rubroshorea leprosula TaxID=152421 RepID=A0AAV5KIC5_9ROSI|nr:hypothetical protein SLEP1_g33983 [Rubroshorea leprosula]
MSGIIDMWTSELAKLQEKGQTRLFPSGSNRARVESTQVAGPQERNSSRLAPAFVDRFMQPKLSEGSVSMIVQWFSP